MLVKHSCCHQICSKTVISKLIVGLKTHYVLLVALNSMYLCIYFSFKHFVLYIQLYIDLCLHFHQGCIQFHPCIHFIPVFIFMPPFTFIHVFMSFLYSFLCLHSFSFLHSLIIFTSNHHLLV